MTIVLCNVRSAWNVGSIMRTCDALGADLILIGYTPRPIGHSLKAIVKTSIGAEKTVKWEHFEHPQEVFQVYSSAVHIAVEISQTSQDLFDFANQNKELIRSQQELFLWFGNEIHGVPKEVVDCCDFELHLQMWGKKESLNVATCVTTIGYLLKFVESGV